MTNSISPPTFASIRQTPKLIPGVSEYYLRMLEKQGKLPGFRAGNRKMVNLGKLCELLESGDLDKSDEEAANE